MYAAAEQHPPPRRWPAPVAALAVLWLATAGPAVAQPGSAAAAPAPAPAPDAEAPEPLVGLTPFTGPAAQPVREALSWVLAAHGFLLLPSGQLKRTANRLAVDLDRPSGLRAVASELGLVAVLQGKVSRQGGKHQVRLGLRSGRDGTLMAEATWLAPTPRLLSRRVAVALWSEFGPILETVKASGGAVERLPPPPPPPPPPSPSPPEVAEAPPAAPAAEATPPAARRAPLLAEAPPVAAAPAPSPAPDLATPARSERPAPPARLSPSALAPAFELTVGPRALYRQLTFDSDPDRALTPFRTRGVVPALAFAIGYYPGVLRRRVGLALSTEIGAPVKARAATDLEYQTPNSDVHLSVLLGIPTRAAAFDLTIGGGRHHFGVAPLGAAATRPRLVPDVTYGYLRGGLGVRVHTGSTPLGILGGFYYRQVLAAGDIAQPAWFPSLSTRAFEGTIGLTYRIGMRWELRLQVDGRLYRHTVSAEPAGGHVTEGAIDQYWTAWLGLSVQFAGDDVARRR